MVFKKDEVIYQGATYQRVYCAIKTLRPHVTYMKFPGFVARADLVDIATGQVIFSFNCTIIDETDVTIELTAAQTMALTPSNGLKYRYNVYIASPQGTVYPVARIRALVSEK